MSRTYRRKNSWDKKEYVDLSRIQDYREWFKYHGLTDKQVFEKVNAWYHGESPRRWKLSKHKKWFCNYFLRAKNRQELIEAIQRGEEENIQMTGAREIGGQWDWYCE